VLVITFLVLTPVALVSCVLALVSVSNNKTEGSVLGTETASGLNLIERPENGISVYASFPEMIPTVGIETKVEDARVEIIKNYLESYDSPLAPYADDIVKTADKYMLDFRLTTAIAQQESNLCKKIPAESFNCWGWGIHSKGTLGFRSYAEAVESVSRGLKEEYLDKGLSSVEEIMSKYTPQSNGSWAMAVNKFMGQME